VRSEGCKQVDFLYNLISLFGWGGIQSTITETTNDLVYKPRMMMMMMMSVEQSVE
jgi:hypothetical protein